MNRILAILLALYILVLTFIPCVDETLHCCEITHLALTTTTNDTHSDQHDTCSPFCTCSCCSLAMEITLPMVMIFVNSDPLRLEVWDIIPLHSSLISSIWEPPKA
ncbi:MAG: hypothetical protein M0P58_05155 [Bacteroidales bacterium]|nr:hypothetical protein [Bacteroidales bacterium]